MPSFESHCRFALQVALGCCVTWAVSGCTLTRKKTECESNAECRSALGTGYVCAESGLCNLAPAQAGCANQSPEDLLLEPEKYRDYIVLGSLLRSTGKEGARQDSATLAIESVNRFLRNSEGEYKQLEGLRFGMVQCDHAGSTEEIEELADYLSHTLQIPAILGPASSSATDAAFRQVNLSTSGDELRSTLFVSPSATSVGLTGLERESPGLLWRTAPVDTGQGALMGTYAAESGEPFAIVYEDTPYGRGLYEALLMGSDDECTNCAIRFDADTGDPVPLVEALASNKAQDAIEAASIVFFIGAQETHIRKMMEKLEDDDYADKMFFFSDAAASSDTIEAIPRGHESRVIGTRVSAPQGSEAQRVFDDSYRGRHDESPLIHSFTANAYDAAWLILLGAIQARLRGDDEDASSIAEGLGRVSDKDWAQRDGSDCPGRVENGVCPPLTLQSSSLPDMITLFTRGEEIDVQGASGSLNYCKSNEELEHSSAAFEIWRVQQDEAGGLEVVADMGLALRNEFPLCPK